MINFKWIDIIFPNLNKNKPNGYWTKERVFKEAEGVNTPTELYNKNKSAHTTAHRNKWLKEIFPNYRNYKNYKPRGYWNRERVFKEAEDCEKPRDLHKKCLSAYNSAYRNDWLKEIFPRDKK